MPDITYADLLNARKEESTGEESIVTMANVALKILEQVNALKAGGGKVMATRPEGVQTQSQKPKISVKQISEALAMVQQLKGDIKVSELQKLLQEHKDQVTGLLEKVA